MSAKGVNTNASKWMLSGGKENDIVISSRIRLARNLAGYHFPHMLNHDQSMQIVEKVASVFANLKGAEGKKYDQCVAIGPMIMMKFVCKLTKELGIPILTEEQFLATPGL